MAAVTRRHFLFRIALAMCAGGCATQPRPRLRVGTYLGPGFEPMFVARHNGALNEKVFQIAEYPTASELMLAFQNGALDAITVTLDDVLRLASYGHDVKIVMLTAQSNGADAILGRSNMADLSALKGKTVGFESNTLGAFLLARALEKHGLSPKDLNLSATRVDRLNRQFTVGLVDAVVTYEPYRSTLVRAGAKVLFDSSELPGEIMDALVVRRPVLEQQTAALDSLVSAWMEGLEFLQKDPRAAAAIVARRERTTPEAFVKSLELVRLMGLEENRRAFDPGNAEVMQRLQRTADFMLRYDLLPRPVAVTTLMDGRLVRREPA
jgi:NitT/TauT family transport system substrate-binding protein